MKNEYFINSYAIETHLAKKASNKIFKRKIVKNRQVSRLI